MRIVVTSEFAGGEFKDRATEFDENEEFDEAIWRKTSENGLELVDSHITN